MAVTGISTKLLYYFQQNTDHDVTIDELMEAMPEYERRQIMSNVRNLMTTEPGKALSVIKSGVWRYNSTGLKDSQNVTFYVLKETTSYLILESPSGAIYRAEFLG